MCLYFCFCFQMRRKNGSFVREKDCFCPGKYGGFFWTSVPLPENGIFSVTLPEMDFCFLTESEDI